MQIHQHILCRNIKCTSDYVHVSDSSYTIWWVWFPWFDRESKLPNTHRKMGFSFFPGWKLRFRTPARDIPPFFLQRRGPERTFMDLNGLETDVSDAVISGSSGKIKDPGDLVRSPIYGAGEGNRTLDVSIVFKQPISIEISTLCLFILPVLVQF